VDYVNILFDFKELTESLNDKDDGTVYTKVCDVTNEQAVKDVFSWVDSTLGGPSILINNAGVAKLSSLLSEYLHLPKRSSYGFKY